MDPMDLRRLNEALERIASERRAYTFECDSDSDEEDETIAYKGVDLGFYEANFPLASEEKRSEPCETSKPTISEATFRWYCWECGGYECEYRTSLVEAFLNGYRFGDRSTSSGSSAPPFPTRPARLCFIQDSSAAPSSSYLNRQILSHISSHNSPRMKKLSTSSSDTLMDGKPSGSSKDERDDTLGRAIFDGVEFFEDSAISMDDGPNKAVQDCLRLVTGRSFDFCASPSTFAESVPDQSPFTLGPPALEPDSVSSDGSGRGTPSPPKTAASLDTDGGSSSESARSLFAPRSAESLARTVKPSRSLDHSPSRESVDSSFTSPSPYGNQSEAGSLFSFSGHWSECSSSSSYSTFPAYDSYPSAPLFPLHLQDSAADDRMDALIINSHFPAPSSTISPIPRLQQLKSTITTLRKLLHPIPVIHLVTYLESDFTLPHKYVDLRDADDIKRKVERNQSLLEEVMNSVDPSFAICLPDLEPVIGRGKEGEAAKEKERESDGFDFARLEDGVCMEVLDFILREAEEGWCKAPSRRSSTEAAGVGADGAGWNLQPELG